MAIFADLSLRLHAQSAELQKGLDQAKNTVKSMGKEISSSMKSAGVGISSALDQMTGGMSSFASSGLKAFKSITTGIKGVQSAFISTGIGAIIVAITVAISGLVAAFKRSGTAADDMEKVLGALKGVLNFLVGLLVKVGEWLIKAFKDPKAAVQELWEVIKQNLVTRFQGVVQMFTAGWEVIKNGAMGVALAIKGIFDPKAREESKKYFQEMKDGFIKMGEAAVMIGTGKTVEELAEGVKKFSDGIKESIKQGQALADMQNQRDELEKKNIKENGAAIRELGRLKEEMASTDRSTQEGAAQYSQLINQALVQQGIINKNNIALKQAEYDLLNAQLQQKSQGNLIDEDEIELLKKKEEIDQARYDANMQNSALIKRDTLLDSKAQDQAAKALLEQQKDSKALRDIQHETALLMIKDAEEAAYKKIEFDKMAALEAVAGASNEMEQRAAIEELYWQKGLALSREYFEQNKELAKQQWDAQQETNAKAAEEEQAKQDKKIENIQMGLDFAIQAMDAISTFQTAAMNRELEAAGNNEAKKEEIRRRYAKKQKAMAIAMTIVNGAQAIIKALADLGPIAGAISAVLIGATTAAQIAVIASQPLAKGGLAYGKTLATVGEYPGARSNPEVIAPLDKLQNILGKQNNRLYGEIRVEGQDLLLAITNAQKIRGAY